MEKKVVTIGGRYYCRQTREKQNKNHRNDGERREAEKELSRVAEVALPLSSFGNTVGANLDYKRSFNSIEERRVYDFKYGRL
ncbi:hypothetical protein PIB30_001040 [Stylosanthes scabra]|uniref:Uncharacterized protein n=1 Tax=Stylosanthes scabra TaxID=79078 RepID=A0ABU6T3J4_9FABA|nr:hypothetical protein [Stylosanthes scabra]